MTARLGNFVDLQAIDLAGRREEQHVAMGRCDEKMLHEVVFFEVHSLHALAAALLLAIGGYRNALDVAGLGHRHGNLFIGDQILDVDVLGFAAKRRTARRIEATFNLEQLFLDHLAHEAFVRKDALVIRDLLFEFRQLVFELMAFQPGQTAKTHLEDRRGLRLGKVEAFLQTLGCFAVGLGTSDDLDDFIDVIKGNEQAF